MNNSTTLPANTTSTASSVSVVLRICVVTPLFGIFLCFIILMLYTMASRRQFWDNSRYILFTYMLINDTLQLLFTVLLFLFTMTGVRMAIVFCGPLLFISSATYQNTPFILATMSLERYIAICYPLRHQEICRVDRTWVVILALWLTSCIIPTIDFALVGSYSIDVYSTPVTCVTKLLNSSHIQTLFKVTVNALFLALVATVILSTYVRILLKAKRMRSDKAPANKALHTVILHGVQLLLCMMSYTYPVTEGLIVVQVGWLREHISFFNYFCFILLPRFLSPLIYGLRDENLRVHMKGSIQCCSTKINPNASGNKFIK
ncbi:odorant receptor 131-2-like [Amia ocellicauda]|uniref:odorant receptor 131-2-like n=1 Tax=Amia ocellicauda TaxID=2972642 RepID=UPI003464ADD7